LNKLVNGLGLGVMAVTKQVWKEADSIWFYKSTAQLLSAALIIHIEGWVRSQDSTTQTPDTRRAKMIKETKVNRSIHRTNPVLEGWLWREKKFHSKISLNWEFEILKWIFNEFFSDGYHATWV
jgi:hypothetical protein